MLSKLSPYSTSILILTISLCSTQLQAETKPSERRYFDANPYTHCHILTSNNTYTLVPKKSVLNLPERHVQRISQKPKGKFLFFNEFRAKNFGWIDTMKVTPAQSKGKDPLSEERLNFLKESGKVIIAVRENRAVPVLSNKPNTTP